MLGSGFLIRHPETLALRSWATHAGARTHLDVLSGDDLSVHQTRAESDLSARSQHGSVHDRFAAAHASASTREGDIGAGANDVIKHIAGQHAARDAELGPPAAAREDKPPSHLEDDLGTSGTGQSDLLTGEADVLHTDHVHAHHAAEGGHGLTVEFCVMPRAGQAGGACRARVSVADLGAQVNVLREVDRSVTAI